MAQNIVVDVAELRYDEKMPDCKVTHSTLDDHTANCNQRQAELEENVRPPVLTIAQSMQSCNWSVTGRGKVVMSS